MPAPEHIERYYPENYDPYARDIKDESSPLRRFLRRRGMNNRVQPLIRRTNKPGRLLDVGCATGLFLNDMRSKGWTCYGVEPSISAAAYASNHFGLDVFVGRLEEAHYPEASFDLITLWDVLEHTPNPRQVLEKSAILLKPGGTLFINIPNLNAKERKWFGPYWAGWDIPRHLHMFPLDWLSKIVESIGLRLTDIEIVTGGYGGLIISLDFWMKGRGVQQSVQTAVNMIVRSVFLQALAFPYYRVMDRYLKSSFIGVFAQKDGDLV
jgi:SAM-dependent methyltransferase